MLSLFVFFFSYLDIDNVVLALSEDILDTEQNLSLTCSCESFPMPNISFYKDGMNMPLLLPVIQVSQERQIRKYSTNVTAVISKISIANYSCSCQTKEFHKTSNLHYFLVNCKYFREVL